MDKIVSAAEANRRFSQLLRSVREGDSYVVTAHGKPVAKIVPANRDEGMMERARALLLARLRSQRALNAGRWFRDELYDDES